jgi:hypothetical protein
MVARRRMPDRSTPPSAGSRYLTYVCHVNQKTDIRLSFRDQLDLNHADNTGHDIDIAYF